MPLAVLCALVLALAGCGRDEPSSRPLPVVRVGLDFTPNAVHAPLYVAASEGLDRRAGVRLDVVEPGSQPDSVKLVLGGRVDIGVLDIHDLGIARQEGRDVVAVAALVDRPLAAILAQPAVRRPRDLEGRRVGVSGLPSDPAFVRAIVEHDGGDFEGVRLVTIGFNAVSALLTGRVGGVPAFWNAEGVALRRRGHRVREFRVEDYGAPAYPEVVLVVRRDVLRTRRQDVRAALEAIAAGARATLARPEAAARRVAQAGDADMELVRAQLRALRGVLSRDLRLERDVLERWADWDVEVGILRERPDVGRAFALDLR